MLPDKLIIVIGKRTPVKKNYMFVPNNVICKYKETKREWRQKIRNKKGSEDIKKIFFLVVFLYGRFFLILFFFHEMWESFFIESDLHKKTITGNTRSWFFYSRMFFFVVNRVEMWQWKKLEVPLLQLLAFLASFVRNIWEILCKFAILHMLNNKKNNNLSFLHMNKRNDLVWEHFKIQHSVKFFFKTQVWLRQKLMLL